MAVYVPRTTAPTGNEKWWRRPEAGGVNPCININNGVVLPNCVGFAWGRFSEIIGTPCSLPTANAGDWWELVRGYDKGQTPKLGSVIVWGKAGEAGHVAIVEQINSDGSILTSNSAYAGTWFYMQTVYPPSYTWGGGYYCKGFIYNPAVSGSTVTAKSTSTTTTKVTTKNPVSEFLNEAMKHVGEDGTWTYRKSGLMTGIAWCAAFVVAVGLQVGNIIGKVIYNSFSVTTMVSEGVKRDYGTFFKGAFFGTPSTPNPGDLIVFRWNNKSSYTGKSDYFADHVAIVREVKNGTVYTVEGNSSDRVKCHQYAVSNPCISGYFRPRWSTIGGTSSSSVVSYSGIDVYDTQSTKEDAAMREVAYITPQGKPSISTASIRLSAINYTSELAALVKLPSDVLDLAASTKVDTSRLSLTNAKTICDYLLSKNFTAAQAVGIMANMRAESGLLPSAINPTSYASGLCQWYASRRTAMISHVGSNWMNNLTGQLDYLWYELNSSEKTAYNALKAITELSEDAAVKCSDTFCKYFERPGNNESVYAIRRTYAKEFWKQLSVVSPQLTTSSTGNSLIITRSGKELSRGEEIIIPPDIAQYGISTNSINYTYESPKYISEKRKAIATLWQKSGRPSNRNIATLNGYFICGVTSKIGEVGDLLMFELSDGTKFTAIVGFSPLPLGQNMWSYEKEDNKYHIIQWAKKGTADNKLNNVLKIDLTSWKGKQIRRVVNYGTYLDEED